MSGIAGYISEKKPTKKIIKAMTDRIEHRGKDGEGHYIEDNIALGHRLLQTNKKVNGEQPLFNKDKDIIVRILRHSDSSITYAVKVWVKSEDYWTTYFDLQENIKEAFDKNKIEIPYPQLDIHQK